MTLKEFLETFENIKNYNVLNVYSTDYIAKHLESLALKDFKDSKYLLNDIQSFSTFSATEFNESSLDVYVFVKP